MPNPLPRLVSAMGLLGATAASVALGLAVLFFLGPTLLGWQGVIVLSGSMEPALKTGGVAFVEPVTNTDRFEVGDIITFKAQDNPDNHISHRIVDILDTPAGQRFQTKGDANDLLDSHLVEPQEIVAQVRFHLPYLGYLADELRNPRSLYLFLGIPALLVIVGELANLSRDLRSSGGAPYESAGNSRRGRVGDRLLYVTSTRQPGRTVALKPHREGRRGP